jgi:hypothetical protein
MMSMIDVGTVISEMNGIGILGFPEPAGAAAMALDVIKKGTKNEGIPQAGPTSFAENQEQARVTMKRMSEIADRMSEMAVGMREQIREADGLLQEMDEAASVLRKVSK